MSPSSVRGHSYWADVRLVVFDVDGTLYDQRALRLRMARDLLVHAYESRSAESVSVLRLYRRIREELGDAETPGFQTTLIARTADAARTSPAAVSAIVAEWIEQRPLRYLIRCRYPGLPELFSGLRRSDKIIGILSDYPARAKLRALGLSADHVVSATDEHVGRMKPHPRGLECLISAANVSPQETVLVGDRIDRDGAVALRAGVRALIRSSRPRKGWHTFARYDGPLFEPVLRLAAPHG